MSYAPGPPPSVSPGLVGADYATILGGVAALFPDIHFVLCESVDDKGPKKVGNGRMMWKDVRPTPEEVYDHGLNAPVGVVPFTMGFTVLDVDNGHPWHLAWKLRPFYYTESKTKGHAHLWFHDDAPRGNSNWRFEQWSGEVRGANGFVVIWQPWNMWGKGLLFSGQSSPLFGDVLPIIQPQTQPKVEGAPTFAPRPRRKGRRVIRDTEGEKSRIERLAQLLAQVSPEPYDTWITVGMCLEGGARSGELTENNAFIIWDNWSQGSSKYPGTGEMTKKWTSFRGEQAKALGSLFHEFGALQ